ncbi:MAG TPA: SCO family protein [Gammaproteobacteria bacterium]|nr:SCO family protein [Gammaproteobacteria bacterium]
MSTANERWHGFPVGTLLLGGLLAAVLLTTHLLVRPPPPPAILEGVLRADFRPLTRFYLNSRSHGPLGLDDLRGKWTFVYFGYRSCPDLCPNTLHELASFRRLLDDSGAADAGRVQVLFVSVDPARDSEEALDEYVAWFDPRFIGATAGRAAIERFARQFGADFAYGEETAPGQYTVSHSSAVFLVDPHARVVATFSEPHYAATLLAQYRGIVDYYASSG